MNQEIQERRKEDLSNYATHKDLTDTRQAIFAHIDKISEAMHEGFVSLRNELTDNKVKSASWSGDINAVIAENEEKKDRASRSVISMSITVLALLFAALWWSIQSSNDAVRKEFIIANQSLEISLLGKIATSSERVTSLEPSIIRSALFEEKYAGRMWQEHVETQKYYNHIRGRDE